MSELDIPEILSIEEDAYEFPWTAGIFYDCLKVGYCCWVIEQDGHIDGYGVMSVFVDEAHILNLCIRSGARNNGLGRKLLDHLMELARGHRADTVFLEVRPSNYQALRIYQRSGFYEVGSRKNYYPAKYGFEDALILARQL